MKSGIKIDSQLLSNRRLKTKADGWNTDSYLRPTVFITIVF